MPNAICLPFTDIRSFAPSAPPYWQARRFNSIVVAARAAIRGPVVEGPVVNPVLANIAIWTVAGVAVAGVVARPFRFPEAVWAVAGAGLLVGAGLVPAARAGAAVARGTDVYLFLAGMMLLSEVARREGVFDWVASQAVRAARGSPRRLFALIYGVGVIVTTILSNDATAVVLTPAV
jgi:arsenical pump membrane protein